MWWDILKLEKLSIEKLSIVINLIDPHIGSEPLRDILNATVYPVQLSSKTRMLLKRLSARKEVDLQLSKLVNRLAIGGKNVIPRTIPESLLDVINASNFSLLNIHLRNLRNQITRHYPRPYIDININVTKEGTVVSLYELDNGIFSYGRTGGRGGILKFNDEDIQYVIDDCRNMGYEISVRYEWEREYTNFQMPDGYDIVGAIREIRNDNKERIPLSDEELSLFDIGFPDAKLSTTMNNNVSILKNWLINNPHHKNYPELIKLFVAWDKVKFKRGREFDLIIEMVKDKKLFKNENTIH